MNLEAQIKEYLKADKMDYWQGVELYESHPQAKRNIVLNLHQRYRLGAMHERLVYELETLVGNKATNRRTELTDKPQALGTRIVVAAEASAPASYEYSVKYADLPDDLKKLVVEKGSLYNTLDALKKKLAKFGELNDETSVLSRKPVMDEMHVAVNRIKSIHSFLIAYKLGDEYDLTKINIEPDSEEEGNEEPEGDISDMEAYLKATFKYESMDYYQRKDLLNRLRSNTIRQKQRAETAKKEAIRAKNIKAAEISDAMIQVLEDWFAENNE